MGRGAPRSCSYPRRIDLSQLIFQPHLQGCVIGLRSAPMVGGEFTHRLAPPSRPIIIRCLSTSLPVLLSGWRAVSVLGALSQRFCRRRRVGCHARGTAVPRESPHGRPIRKSRLAPKQPATAHACRRGRPGVSRESQDRRGRGSGDSSASPASPCPFSCIRCPDPIVLTELRDAPGTLGSIPPVLLTRFLRRRTYAPRRLVRDPGCRALHGRPSVCLAPLAPNEIAGGEPHSLSARGRDLRAH